MKGGSILLLHSQPSYTTEESRSKPYGLLVSLSTATKSARGEAIIDDGVSLEKSSLDITFTANDGNVSGSVERASYISSQPLSDITVLGVTEKPTAIKVNGGVIDDKKWTYESGVQRLNISDQDVALHKPWKITWG